MSAARRCLAALAVLSAGACASSSSRAIAVSVTELREGGPRRAVGEHYYRVRVTNRSAEQITVERIRIDLASDLDVEDSTENFDEQIGPEETRPFDVMIRVMENRALRGGYIDSVRVTIEARNEKGSFTDSGDYWIGAERAGR
jgi:hypothetical protein